MNHKEYIHIIILLILLFVLFNYILYYKSISCFNRINIAISLIVLPLVIYGIKTRRLIQYFKYNRVTSLEINKPGYIIGIWTLTHFLCWACVGLVCPNAFYQVLTIGLIWEVSELIFEYDKQVVQSRLLCKYINRCSKQSKISKELFWKNYFGLRKKRCELFYCSGGFYGQLVDILANSLGFMTGAYLHIKYL